jgi:hypothetical protein
MTDGGRARMCLEDNNSFSDAIVLQNRSKDFLLLAVINGVSGA